MCSGEPTKKILDRSKLEGFADDKINVTKKLKFVFGWLENIVRKGENARNCIRSSYMGSLTVMIVW